MKLNPRLHRHAVKLVASFERFEPRAVRRPEGGWVIGYGHTLTAREGAEIGEADARALLMFDLSQVADAVEAALEAPVDDNQFEALTAFAFNVGIPAFLGSSTLSRLNAGEVIAAAEEIERWRRSEVDGEETTLDPLVRRRAAEKLRFLTPPEGFPKTSTPFQPPSFERPTRPAPPPPAPPVEAAEEPSRGPAPIPAVANDEIRPFRGPTEPAAPPFDPFDREPAEPSINAGEPFSPSAPAANLPALREVDAPHPQPPPLTDAERLIRRGVPITDTPGSRTRVELEEGRTGPLGRFAYGALGVIGVLMFIGAVISIVEGRPNGLNLGFGLIGVMLTMPAVFGLFGLSRLT